MKMFLPVVLGLVVLQGCFRADLRTDAVVDRGDTPAAVARGKAILLAAVNAHGGIERFRNARTAVVTMQDHWPMAITHPFMPWDDHQRLKMTLALGRDDSRLEFLDGKRMGWSWGIQQWHTYTVAPGGAPVFEQDDDIQFWLPTLQYFFELPFRFLDADVVVDAGPSTIHGVAYDRVLVSWRTVLPQDDRDQYLVWVNRQTHLVDYVRYTVREKAPFIAGIMQYSNHHNVDGLVIPFTQTVVVALAPGSTRVLHTMEIDDVKLGVDVPPEVLVPQPHRHRPKH